jgi:hypothetical protein
MALSSFPLTIYAPLQVLKEQLSPVQQYQYYQVQQLRSGTAEERAAAINALSECRRPQVLQEPCWGDMQRLHEPY